MTITDGIINIANKLANRRNPLNQNRMLSDQISYTEVREMIRHGLSSKIVRTKSAYALNDTLLFDDKGDQERYRKHLERFVKEASYMMIAYGRACIVLITDGEDLSAPKTTPFDINNTRLKVLTPDIIQAVSPSLDLRDVRYNKASYYNAKGVQFHHSRVVDFIYVKPADMDLPNYNYGGISEFELIRDELINDGIVSRASARALEINSTFWHKVAGFKDQIESGQDNAIIQYYSSLEDIRSLYGAGVIDAEDDVISVSQTLTNLQEVDQITLRRLAMVTGIPLAILVGENVKGLNSSGEQERIAFQDMIENLQSEHLIEPINELLSKFGMQEVQFKENQGGSPNDRIEFQTKVINNARALYEMGEDHNAYLLKNEIIQPDQFEEFFGSDD